jgi:hypothetical protein
MNPIQPLVMGLGALFLIASASLPARAETLDQRVKLLEATLQDLFERDKKKDREIARLRRLVKGQPAAVRESEHPHETGHKAHGDHAAGTHGQKNASDQHHNNGAVYSRVIQGRKTSLDWVGVSVDAAGGYNSEPSAVSQNLQGGGHDPKATGFRLQSADFSMAGSVERAFDAELHIAFVIDQLTGATGVELEEAFLRTNFLPYGFDVEAGQMFTEFGIHNPMHLHEWAWIDQPVINTRMFGGDGMRQVGVRIGWLAPKLGAIQSHIHVGAQNPTGETMKSFLGSDEALSERARRKGNVNGIDDLVYLVRMDNRLSLGKETMVRAGFSAVFGPNATGSTGDTQIYGADLTVERALSKQWSARWSNEFMYRTYKAQNDLVGGTASDSLVDYGFYSQVALDYSDKYWVGLRYERATGSGDEPARDSNSDLDLRQRFSPIVGWQFAPGAQLRLQYNYDKADHLNAIDGKDDASAHAVWAGLGWTFGAGKPYDHKH